MSKNSLKKTVECFSAALPKFLQDQEHYKLNRTKGTRPKKEVTNGK